MGKMQLKSHFEIVQDWEQGFKNIKHELHCLTIIDLIWFKQDCFVIYKKR